MTSTIKTATTKRKRGVVPEARPRVHYEEADDASLLVRLDDDDEKFLKDFYRWLALHGLSVLDARQEFSLMERVRIPAYLRPEFERDFELVEA